LTISTKAIVRRAALLGVLLACAGCSATYTVGGTVSGLTGTGLVLQNNGGNDLAISANGAFTFLTALKKGASYSVTVLTPPSGEGCSVTNGGGTVASTNVTDVAVTCATPPSAPTLGLAFGVKELQFTWAPIGGATFYRLLESRDGGPTFNFSEGFSLMVLCKTQQEVDKYWTKLTENGGEEGPCGWLKDRFGVSWQIIPEVLGQMLSDSKSGNSEAAMQAMLKMKKLDIATLEKAYRGSAVA